MIVADLSADELRHALDEPGLRIRVGPIVVAVRSPFRTVVDGLALHYAAHEIGPPDFADFHVSVEPPFGLRRWFTPQALFRFDGSPPFTPLPAAQAFPLFEWGLNWSICAHCHQYVVVHAAVIAREDRAMILPAPPGSGKSTLCAALAARGWRLLSDELTLIDIEAGVIVPIPRPISLKNASIATIARFWPEAPMGAIVPDTLKGSVAHVQPPAQSVRSSAERAVPAWIVVPRYRPAAAAELAPLGRSAAFMQLADNAFNYSTHGRRGFERLADVVDRSRCFEFTYGGALDDAVQTFDRLANAA